MKKLSYKRYNSYFKLTIKKTSLLINLCVLLLLLSCNKNIAQSSFNQNHVKPNIIVIILDDQGYADVGFQKLPASSQVLTPNINKLSESGITFTNAYVSSS